VYSVIAEVIRNVIPKWRARQVTVSPSFIIPLVTPPIARSPDALIEVALPATPSQIPKVRRAVSLPTSPADIALIRRPGGADLLAIAAERLGALVIYDTGNRQVVAQVDRLGDTPFTLKLLPSPSGSARLVASVFGDCRLSLIEVPLDQPWNAALRGRAGKCP